MAIDTLFVYCGVYGEAADALADYELIKDLHTEANLIDAYDAAVIERDHKGKVKIVKKTRPRRAPAVCSAVGSAWPRASSSSCSGRRHRRRSPARHHRCRRAARGAGRSRRRGHEPGDLVKTWANPSTKVRPASSSSPSRTWRPRSASAMKRAQKIEEKQLKADQKELETDAAEAQKS